MNRLLSVAFFCLVSLSAAANDWPSWLGSEGDAVLKDEQFIKTIPQTGLKTKWEVPVNLGYSGPSVADGKVFVMDYIKTDGEITNRASWSDKLTGQERVVCLDEKTGKELWVHAYPRSYTISYAGGPRCTPIYSEGRVYALGAEGDLKCLDAESGTVLWSKNFYDDYGAETPRWGHAAHPLVYDDLLICIVGGIGSVAVAFDKVTGEERWSNLSADTQGYCPPSIVHHAGVDQLIIWHPEGLYSLNPLSGRVYWTQDLRPKLGLTVSAPRKSGHLLYASGQGGAGGLYRLNDEKPDSELVWLGNPRNAIYTLNNTPAFTENAIYGVDLETSALTAVNPIDGSRIWETLVPVIDKEIRASDKKRIRHGTAFLIRHQATDVFYIFSENGDLILAELTPSGYNELGRQNVLEPTSTTMGRTVVWSHPAFANQTMFARSDENVVAIDLDTRNY
jgi:outer membrane protein assembly factor BamB